MKAGLASGPDGRPRCGWGVSTEDYVAYHDTEWGYPVRDDRRLFEKLCLEGFQSGLSWITILRKRPAFRAAFANFEMARVAKFGARSAPSSWSTSTARSRPTRGRSNHRAPNVRA